MSALEAAEDAASRYALPWLGKIAAPWILAVLVMVATGIGTAGLYFGAQIEHGRNAKVLLQMKDAQIDALRARDQQYLDARARGDEIADRFDASLKGLSIVNKTYHAKVEREVQQQIYIDCKVPETGLKLLRQHIEEANAAISKGTR